MNEYCLISPSGSVVNMCMTTRVGGPMTETQEGYKWVPVGSVPMSKLSKYRYWSERP